MPSSEERDDAPLSRRVLRDLGIDPDDHDTAAYLKPALRKLVKDRKRFEEASDQGWAKSHQTLIGMVIGLVTALAALYSAFAAAPFWRGH
jgi:hypothetical protein